MQNAFTELTAAQAEMNKLRWDEYTSFVAAKADLEQDVCRTKKGWWVVGTSCCMAHGWRRSGGTAMWTLLWFLRLTPHPALKNEIDKTNQEQDISDRSGVQAGLSCMVFSARYVLQKHII